MLNHYGSVTPLLRMSRKPPLTVLSSGAGQDSAALLALCLEDAAFQRRYIPGDLLVMMSATGNEHHETDRYRQRSADLCAERGVPFIHVTPDLSFHSPAWQTLHHQWSRHDSIQSRLFPSPIDLVRLHKGHPESFELWAQFEDRKLAKWVGTRNHTVFGNDLTLRQNLDKALVEFGHLDTAELDAIRMQRGHGNSTPF